MSTDTDPRARLSDREMQDTHMAKRGEEEEEDCAEPGAEDMDFEERGGEETKEGTEEGGRRKES